MIKIRGTKKLFPTVSHESDTQTKNWFPKISEISRPVGIEQWNTSFLVVDTRSVGRLLPWVRICKFVTHSDVNKIDNTTWDQLISTFRNNVGTVLFT